MGKVLKAIAIIAVAVAVAYFAPQISAALISTGLSAATATAITTTLVSTAIAVGLSAGASLLAGKPSTSNSAPSIFRQTVSNSFIVYGKRRVGGLLIFFHPKGKDYRYFVIAVAGHRCKGVVRWWLNDDQVFVDSSGKVTSGKYAGNAWLWFYRGTDDQAAHPTFVSETEGKWTSAHRGRGTALIYAKFKMTDDVIQAGMPNITAEVEGKDDILDPRTGDRGYTRNAELVFYDWLALPREEGGFGAFEDEIDWDWVAAQANVCDELVDTPSGQERRYEFDSYIQTGSAPSEIRDTFVTCCAGTFTYSGGKMLLRPGYYVPPSATLSEEDLAAPITVPALLAGDQVANEITGTYIKPDKYQPDDVPTRSLYAEDVRQQPYDLPHITSIYRGQRILEIYLRKAQAERRVTWPMNIMGLAISTLDTVQLGTARYGLSNYAFQVASWGLSTDFSVVLQLEEHNADIFEFTSGMYLEPGEVGELTPAEPIDDVPPGSVQSKIRSAYPVPRDVLTADDAGDGTATIHVDEQSWDYPGATTDVVRAAGVITGLNYEAGYYVYFDDETLAEPAPTYHATSVLDDALNSTAAPFRHYLGYIETPVEGGGTSSGGGGGGGYGGTPSCPTEDGMILIANENRTGPGGEIRAGDIVPGVHWAWTRHEKTGEWGAFLITAVGKRHSKVMTAQPETLPQAHPDVPVRELTASPGHRMDDGITLDFTRTMNAVGADAGHATVLRITVRHAKTYVVNGVLSHNLKQQEPAGAV